MMIKRKERKESTVKEKEKEKEGEREEEEEEETSQVRIGNAPRRQSDKSWKLENEDQLSSVHQRTTINQSLEQK